MRSGDGDRPNPVTPGRRPRDLLGPAACVVVGVFVLCLSWIKLSSVDLGYHLAYGRHFLETGEIVGRDPFLYPEIARPFVNANWGSQVIMALVYRWTGAWGLSLLRVALIAVPFACIALIIRTVAPGRHWIAWAWLLAAVAGYERFSLRPELFSYALMTTMLVLLWRGLRRRRSVAALAALQLAWVNLHSYFLVGLMLTGSWLIGEVWRLFRAGGRMDVAAPLRASVRRHAAALGLQIAVCFVNPWGHRGAFFPIETLGFLQSKQVMGGGEGWSGESPWSAISEFKSPFGFLDEPINARTIHAYLALFGIAALGVAALAAQGRLGPAIAVILLMAMSTQMRRNIAQLALVAAPLAMTAFSALRAWSPSAARIGRGVRAVLLAATIGVAAWWTYGVVNGSFYFAERRVTREFGVGFNDRVFARQAAQWIAANDGLQPNLYVNYFASSNALIWLPRRFRLLVDTNTFAYAEDVLATAYKLGLGQADYNPIFDRHNVNVALLHAGSNTQMLIRNLAKDYTNWALVYFDRHSVVFVRRIMDHVPIIIAHRLDERSLDAAAWIDEIKQTRRGARRQALELSLSAGVPLSLGWHRAAVALCDEAVRLAPDYHEAWQFLGVAHGNLGNEAARRKDYDEARRRYSRAAECFEQVLTLAPDHREALEYGKLTILKLRELAAREADQTNELP